MAIVIIFILILFIGVIWIRTNPHSTELQNQISTNLFINEFNISEEILELLWFADGPLKNYNSQDNCLYKFENNDIKISFSNQDEPSLIYTKYPISQTDLDELKDNIGYYPTYEELTPEQKFLYLKWLENPFLKENTEVNTGYVFLFYYGLERHLFLKKSMKSFNMIYKLYKKFDNNSFRAYSYEAMLFFTLFTQKMELVESLLKEAPYISSLVIYAKYILREPLYANEIMEISSQVDFSNKRYIKNEPLLFEKILEENILKKLDGHQLFLDVYFSKKLDPEYYPVVANISLRKINYGIPNIFSNSIFKEYINNLLTETHEQVKITLRNQRKKKY